MTDREIKSDLKRFVYPRIDQSFWPVEMNYNIWCKLQKCRKKIAFCGLFVGVNECGIEKSTTSPILTERFCNEYIARLNPFDERKRSYRTLNFNGTMVFPSFHHIKKKWFLSIIINHGPWLKIYIRHFLFFSSIKCFACEE